MTESYRRLVASPMQFHREYNCADGFVEIGTEGRVDIRISVSTYTPEKVEIEYTGLLQHLKEAGCHPAEIMGPKRVRQRDADGFRISRWKRAPGHYSVTRWRPIERAAELPWVPSDVVAKLHAKAAGLPALALRARPHLRLVVDNTRPPA